MRKEGRELLFYDKYGGPRWEERVMTLLAFAVGQMANSNAKVVKKGLYSTNSASVATASSAWQIGQLHRTQSLLHDEVFSVLSQNLLKS